MGVPVPARLCTFLGIVDNRHHAAKLPALDQEGHDQCGGGSNGPWRMCPPDILKRHKALTVSRDVTFIKKIAFSCHYIDIARYSSLEQQWK